MENDLEFIEIIETMEILKLLIYLEAQGEPFQGKLAVAWVVRNRKEDPGERWPNTWKGVIFQPKQFTCFNGLKEKKYWQFMEQMRSASFIIQKECRAAAFLVYHNWIRDFTEGANHYYEKSILPDWAADKVYKNLPLPYMAIGNHRFLKI